MPIKVKMYKGMDATWVHLTFTKWCSQCEKKFTSYAPNAKFCSEDCKIKHSKVWRREYNVRKKYGLSKEEYNKKLTSQDHRCEICKSTKTLDYGKRLAVDHNHKTGKIRDLLCSRCNWLVGAFEDEEMSSKIRAYLNRHL